jgi:putative ATPase
MMNEPLSYMLKPKHMEDFVGQTDIRDALSRLLEVEKIPFSLIFFGPPGVGKTVYAHIFAHTHKYLLLSMNASGFTVGDLRKNLKTIKERPILLLIDEIHRLNRVQQEVLLPLMEKGEIVVVGTSTENPSFTLTKAFRSRSLIYEFKALSFDELNIILDKALIFLKKRIDDETRKLLFYSACGDGRRLLNSVELLSNKAYITKDEVNKLLGANVSYNRVEEHYNIISAFIKSIRGSDADASLYWLARMLKGGEDPLFIGRRLIILSSEDIGNADPQALSVAVNTYKAVEAIGLPEGKIPLAQCTIYLSTAPKSNASYKAIEKALKDVKEGLVMEVPSHLKNAFRSHYLYPHDFDEGYVKQAYIPKKVNYYMPTDRGYEKKIKEFLRMLNEY